MVRLTSRRSGLSRGAAAATLLVALLFHASGPALAVGATGRGDPAPTATELEVLSVSPWVEADGEFEVRFAIPRGWPVDTTISATVRQRLNPDDGSLRDATEELLADGVPTRNLQAPLSFPVLSLLDDDGAAALTIPVRADSGDSDRLFIPTAGIHPVDLRATDAEGEVLAESVLYLNRLPASRRTGRDGAPAQTSVQLLAGLDSGPALGVDGEPALSTEELLGMAPWQELVSTNLDLPLTVSLRPDTLLALQRSADPADRAFVAALAEPNGLLLAPQSYVRVDAAGLVSATGGELTSQVQLGASVLTDITGAAPNGPWILDDTVDEASAGVLRGLGVEHLVVSEDRLELETTGEEDDSDGESQRAIAAERTLELVGVPEMTVSTYDAPASRLLVAPELPAATNAHRVTTALLASWFDAVAEGPEAFPGVSAALLLSPSVERQVLEALVASMPPDAAGNPLALAGPPEATRAPDGSPLRARLRGRDAEDLDRVVQSKMDVAARIDGFASMVPDGDPAIAEWHLVNDQTLSLTAGAAERASLWDGLSLNVDEQLAAIDIPDRRTVVLTTRSGSIPVRIDNGLDVDVRLTMTARSPRLDFPTGPSTEVVLTPGANRIDLPVEVQAPGSSLLRIEFTSPDGSLVLPEATVTVRSSSISGVGAALSGVSLLVLGLWWLRTHRSRRADRAKATDEPGPGDTVGTEVAGEPDHGER